MVTQGIRLYPLTWTVYDSNGAVSAGVSEEHIAANLRDNAQAGNTDVYALSENEGQQYRMEVRPNV
jgi:hypothetical protein